MHIKICGVTSASDAALAAELGADHIGLNFWPGSKRFVSVAEGQAIAAAIPAGVRKVGVFVNAAAEDIEHVVMRVGLDLVQLHGDEPPELDDRLPVPVIRALRVASAADVAAAARHPAAWAILLDAAAPGYGGSGRTFDWSLAAGAGDSGRRLFLAGGLTADNVAAAARAVRPSGVDVAGGVESSAGKKDRDKLRRFIETAKGLSW